MQTGSFYKYKFDEKISTQAKISEQQCRDVFDNIDDIRNYNTQKVLYAFSNNRISESHLKGTTGYGYDDRGRDALDQVVAEVFGAEDALVRHNFISGTHAISVALFGVLRPEDIMLSITGRPYDTLEEVIGLKGSGNGSLADFGIKYDQVDLLENGKIDKKTIFDKLNNNKIKVVYLQRSKGYSIRPSINISEMEELFCEIRKISPESIIMVDNCYGEFVEKQEPTDVGADLIIGSMIKNPGGGIAETGGYIAGRKDLIELCSYRLTTVGTGKEVGCTMNQNKNMYLGFFLAPNVVAEAVKTAVFAANFFANLGYVVYPKWDEKRTDIIQALELKNPDRLKAFCTGIQQAAPIDSFVTPEPWDMPGYSDPVIMAAGAFHMGASIELSADAPIREPYAVWMQGGLTYASGRIGILLAAQSMLDKKAL